MLHLRHMYFFIFGFQVKFRDPAQEKVKQYTIMSIKNTKDISRIFGGICIKTVILH